MRLKSCQIANFEVQLARLVLELRELNLGWLHEVSSYIVLHCVIVLYVGHILLDDRVLHLYSAWEILRIEDETTAVIRLE